MIHTAEQVKELLKPRYKVVADYPDSQFYIGAILIPNRADGAIDNCWVTPDIEDRAFGMMDVSKYPHLFRKLHWWQERSSEEMPKYIKCGANGKPRQILTYLPRLERVIFVGGRERNLNDKWIPITEEEFNKPWQPIEQPI